MPIQAVLLDMCTKPMRRDRIGEGSMAQRGMDSVNEFEPKTAELRLLWSRLSSTTWRRRLDIARKREATILQVRNRAEGVSESEAVSRLGAWANRSSVRRWLKRYEELGLEGLIDRRIPPRAAMPDDVRNAICGTRLLCPELGGRAIAAQVKKRMEFETTESTVNRVLLRAGLNRQRGPAAGSGAACAGLTLGGAKLLEVASVETGYVPALAKGVLNCARDAKSSLPRADADTSDRDEFGRFLPSYNERFRKAADAEVAPGYASVEDKREGMDVERLHLSGCRQETIERKLYALLTSPLIGSSSGDGLRVPRGEILGELCGFPYMPSTLDLFARELKYLGVSNTLWEIHARLWLSQTAHWGSARNAIVSYVDGTTKPVWTDTFSQASKVSSVGRVMPSLEVVSFHSSCGVPIWMLTHSGRAPLVNVVPEYLERLSTFTGDNEIGRVVVIDAEGNAIPFYKSLENGSPRRAWISRLRGSFIAGKRIFNRTNYRPYRNGDRIRMGLADFNDPDGGNFRMRVIEVERRTKGTITYLGASTLLSERDWRPEKLADFYFERWPKQEANFRAVNQAVGCKDVHGHGKKLVDNVTVITKLDKLAAHGRRLQERAERSAKESEEKQLRLHEIERVLRGLSRRSDTVNRNIAKLREGRRISGKDARLLRERRDLDTRIHRNQQQAERLNKQLERSRNTLTRTQDKLTANQEEQAVLESRRRIFRHDVELDSLFSLLKFGLVLLVTYVIREYLGDARMAPETFLERIASLPARLQCTPELEILTFEYNRRDAEMMALLAACREALNTRRLRTRSGRTLRIEIDPAPEPRRRVPTRRANTNAQTHPT